MNQSNYSTALPNLLLPTGTACASDIEITGLSLDSRACASGDLFFAYPGVQADGRQYIQEAVSNGAAAVLVEANGYQGIDAIGDIPIIAVNDLQTKVSALAHRFYHLPSLRLSIDAVTGTNGKSTIAYWLSYAMSQLRGPSAVMGTIGVGGWDNLAASALTTADPIACCRTLSQFVNEGVAHVAMEVSSHALAQHRVDAVAIERAIFTNLSQDHLDYHPTMTDYANAKRRLFEFDSLDARIINIDDPIGRQWIREFADQDNTIAYTIANEPQNGLSCVVQANILSEQDNAITLAVKSPWGEGQFCVPVVGHFNASNVAAVIASLGSQGITLGEMQPVIESLPVVPGRMQVIHHAGYPTIVVDYAHTPDALDNALQALTTNTRGNLIVVFGCGGDRDASKRELMGAVAGKHCSSIIVTDDNPRTESPEAIRAQVLARLQGASAQVFEIGDRRDAITKAVAIASSDDTILIAGKGHEDYQIIGTERHPFSDVEVATGLIG